MEKCKKEEKIDVKSSSTQEINSAEAKDKNIGDMTIKEGWDFFKDYVKKLKLKQLLEAFGIIFSLVLAILFAYFAIFPLLKFIWHTAEASYNVIIGESIDKGYYVIIFSLLVSIIVGFWSSKYKILSGVSYSIFLFFLLGFWGEINMNYDVISGTVLGSICFYLVFILLPLLVIIKRCLSYNK